MSAKLKVLVVTDRFPPETEGGAEISLFDTLHAMPDGAFDVRVVSLSQSVHEPCWSDEIGLPVMRVQQSNEWPQRMLRAREQGGGARKIAAALLGDSRQRPGPFFRALQFGALRALGTEPACPGSDRDLIADSEATCERLNKVVRDWKPDVIHADNKLSILLATNLTRTKIPVVAMVRDHRFFCGHVQQSMLVDGVACQKCGFECASKATIPWARSLKRVMAREALYRRGSLARADRVITTSSYLAETLNSIGVSAPLNAIGNPHPNFLDRAVVNADPDVRRVLFAGNLRREKGVHLLLDILPKLKDIPKIRITFAGRGPAESDIRQAAITHDMSDQVEIKGHLDRIDMMQLIQSSRVVVSPTLWPEPFGRLPLEAAIAGRPVIASAHGGHLETIQHNQTGILVRPGDRSDLLKGILQLVQNPEQADEFGRNAEQYVRKIFNPAVIAERLASEWRLAAQSAKQTKNVN